MHTEKNHLSGIKKLSKDEENENRFTED